MKKNKRKVHNTSYKQNLFNKYKIDERKLNTKRQREACLDLLELVDKKQVKNEQKLIHKVADTFRGTTLHKKVASCITIAGLMLLLQNTTIIAKASSNTPLVPVTSQLQQASKDSAIRLIAKRTGFYDNSAEIQNEVLMDGGSGIPPVAPYSVNQPPVL